MATQPDFRLRLVAPGLGLALLLVARLAAAGAPEGDRPVPGEAALAAEHARLARITAVYAEFYRRPPEVVGRLLRLGLPPDDVSVILFVAEKGSADPHAIASVRSTRRLPWHTLMRTHQVRPGALAIRLDGPRPSTGPYAHAFRVLGGSASGPLTDEEVRDLVQLRLVTRHFGVKPSRVLARRAAGATSTEVVLDLDRARPRAPAKGS